MPQLIYLLEAPEVTALLAGHSVPIPAGVTMLAAQTRRNGLGNGAKPSGQSLTSQRGNCPYCPKEDILVYPHVKHMHPGKSVPWLGEGGVKCPECALLLPSAISLQTHRQAHKGTKKSAKKTPTKSATKKPAATKGSD